MLQVEVEKLRRKELQDLEVKKQGLREQQLRRQREEEM